MLSPARATALHSSGTAASMTTAPPPFLPQDVFRLVVRLEAHKVLGDVDVGALERKFRVPLGYSEEDSLHKRERLALKNLPGPGAYEVVDPWQLDDLGAHESAVFASRTERDLYQLPSPTRVSSIGGVGSVSSAGRGVLDPALPLGSFSRCARGLGSESASRRQLHRHSLHGDESVRPSHSLANDMASPVRSLLSSQSAVFPRVSKERESSVPVSDPSIAPGMYDVRRLWDAPSAGINAVPHSQRRLYSDKPSAAVFGASREKREVMWSPAHSVPSCAVPEAWNASPHYAKQKTRVVRAAEREKRVKSAVKTGLLTHSRSSSRLASLNARSSTITSSGDADPFEWLRKQPQGEHRVHTLAAKYGLLEHPKVHTLSHGPSAMAATAVPECTSVDDELCSSAKQLLAHQRSFSDLHTQRQQLTTHPSELVTEDVDNDLIQDDDQLVRSAKDVRIVVRCRLPGGMMLSATLFSRKRVRHLKACIVQSQTRFTHDEQFDLYLPNGRKLAQLDATLQACGLVSRSLVQIVPCASRHAGTTQSMPSPAAPAPT